MNKFKLVSQFNPTGDQPQAITGLVSSLRKKRRAQTLLGVTGSGKTFTLACAIEKLNRPVLVISHNKTLASQLYSEFKEFFPHNAVEYFVSYYDYYQPESYLPQTDTYIEKDASINERLDRLRLSATTSLVSRRDVIVVASVSCIYNLGSPEDYQDFTMLFETGQEITRRELLNRLISLQYERNDVDFHRGAFRVRGDTVDLFPSYREQAIRIEFFGDQIQSVYEFNPLTGQRGQQWDKISVYPAKHFMIGKDRIERALVTIDAELQERLNYFRANGKVLEAERLKSRTRYDMEMLKEMGYCHGIENYSRHLSGRPPGSRPDCLLNYFDKDFLTVIDESHVTIPQIKGMYFGDRSRKESLVKYGFRLPSCLDNRPLRFEEFTAITGQIVFVSATPADYEVNFSGGKVIEQIIRPTGLVDPEIEVRPVKNQIDDLIHEIRLRIKNKERTLVTTLTKRMAEELAQYMQEEGLKVTYLHSEIDALGRAKILKDLRLRKIDVLVGVNLLREGLDLPEVSLVIILDADKEGFLRSQTSLIQTAGRCARHINGKVLLYADTVTNSMAEAMKESSRRRTRQIEYNHSNNITPRTIEKAIRDGIEVYLKEEEHLYERLEWEEKEMELVEVVAQLEKEMYIAAENLRFERAARLRDKAKELKELLESRVSGKKKR